MVRLLKVGLDSRILLCTNEQQSTHSTLVRLCAETPIPLILQALRSLETGCDGWSLPRGWKRMTRQQLEYGMRVPNPERVLVLKQARRPPLAARRTPLSSSVYIRTLLRFLRFLVELRVLSIQSACFCKSRYASHSAAHCVKTLLGILIPSHGLRVADAVRMLVLKQARHLLSCTPW